MDFVRREREKILDKNKRPVRFNAAPNSRFLEIPSKYVIAIRQVYTRVYYGELLIDSYVNVKKVENENSPTNQVWFVS